MKFKGNFREIEDVRDFAESNTEWLGRLGRFVMTEVNRHLEHKSQ